MTHKEFMVTSVIKAKIQFRKALFVVLSICIIVFILKNMYGPTFHNSTYATGYVIGKYQDVLDNKSQNFVVMSFKTNDVSETTNELLIVPEDDIWESILVEKAYYVNYIWDNYDIPIIVEISLNQEFMQIYDKNFIKK